MFGYQCNGKQTELWKKLKNNNNKKKLSSRNHLSYNDLEALKHLLGASCLALAFAKECISTSSASQECATSFSQHRNLSHSHSGVKWSFCAS